MDRIKDSSTTPKSNTKASTQTGNVAPHATPLTRWLATAPSSVFNTYAVVAAFSTYFCMYAFRKPFAVGVFEGSAEFAWLPELDYKILLLIAQVLGYCISKFAGIKIVSEMRPGQRAIAIIACIGVAELALALFAITPRPYGALFLFLNGLPLGMVWGLVFGFLEGRRQSELLGVGLSASYIIASGFVKTIGRFFISAGIPEVWMPFVTGLCFLPALVFFVWLLKQLPPPSEKDEALRTRREPMDAAQRKAFILRFAPGLLPLTILYIALTAYRDFRDNFAREIWDALGYASAPEILTFTEIPIAFGVLIVLGLLMLVRDNRRALYWVHIIMMTGTALIGLSTLAFQFALVGPVAWMILVGLGLYLAYVPYGCILFDRLLAVVGFVGTAAFMIYVTDAFGYLGSVALMLYKNFGHAELSWLEFFRGFSYVTSILCGACFLVSMFYFARTTSENDRPSEQTGTLPI